MLDGVFAFLQLGDVQLRLGAVQPFEPHLIVVDGGDDGAAGHKHTTTSANDPFTVLTGNTGAMHETSLDSLQYLIITLYYKLCSPD